MLVSHGAMACSPFFDDRSPREIRQESKPAISDQQCRVNNIGVYDYISLGRAEDLGNGRIQQVIGDSDQAQVYLADCNTREAIILVGKATRTGLTSCGPMYDYAALAGENAMMSLSQGKDLHALVSIGAALGTTERNPIDEFMSFDLDFGETRHEVGDKDRFDLMCGCKIFYPDTPGGRR